MSLTSFDDFVTDLHCHSTFSDGVYTVDHLCKLAEEEGLKHIAVSDHNTLAAAKYAYDNKRIHGVELIPAVEWTAIADGRSIVHILNYFPKNLINDSSFKARDHHNLDAEALLKELKEHGGIVVVAHPEYYNSMAFCKEMAKKGLIDGIETNHPTTTPAGRTAAFDIVEKYNLLGTGGSDYHGFVNRYHPSRIGFCRTDTTTLNKLKSMAKQLEIEK